MVLGAVFGWAARRRGAGIGLVCICLFAYAVYAASAAAQVWLAWTHRVRLVGRGCSRQEIESDGNRVCCICGREAAWQVAARGPEGFTVYVCDLHRDESTVSLRRYARGQAAWRYLLCAVGLASAWLVVPLVGAVLGLAVPFWLSSSLPARRLRDHWLALLLWTLGAPAVVWGLWVASVLLCRI